MSEEIVVKLVMPAVNWAGLADNLVYFSGWIFLITFLGFSVVLPYIRFDKDIPDFAVYLAMPYILAIIIHNWALKETTVDREHYSDLEEKSKKLDELYEVEKRQ